MPSPRGRWAEAQEELKRAKDALYRLPRGDQRYNDAKRRVERAERAVYMARRAVREQG